MVYNVGMLVVILTVSMTATAGTSPCICTFEYKPLCGTNGITYPNQCTLECAQSSEPELRVSHEGDCREERIKRSTDCPCPRHWRPICGTDGVTYSNHCLFHCAQASNPNITLKHEGECDEDCSCPRSYKPVCSNKGKTYPNKCSFNCARSSNPELEIEHEGQCSDNRIVKRITNNHFNCPCTRILHRVCGTDGITYSNPCLLECAAKSIQGLKIAHEGRC